MTWTTRTLVVGSLSASAALLAAGLAVWQWMERSVTTDDAFTEADVVDVGAEVSGIVRQIRVGDNAHVDAGTPLLELDAHRLSLERDAAQAARDGARAQRDEVLASGAAAGPTQRFRQEAADAAVRLAEARLAQTELALDKAHVSAPVAGFVSHRMVSVGDSVRAGQPLLAIVSDHGWIVANLKETQLQDVKPGRPAVVKLDAYPTLEFKAHVDGIQHGTGQVFSVLPVENATGSFVKIVQRVPVRLTLDGAPATPLLPGLSAHVSIQVR